MRVCVLGATGMAGHMIALYLAERGHRVVGTYRKCAPVLEHLEAADVDLRQLDAFDARKLEALAVEGFDAVVNAMGLLVKECDRHPDRAVYLNAYLPHYLETLAKGSRCRIVQLSTDCVFSGDTGPYTETSQPDGLLFYDRVKALGELSNGKDLTLRQSIVGPDPTPEGIGLLNWFMAQEEMVHGWTRAMWTGLTTLELARAIEACLADGSVGLVNMVPMGNISKYELLRLFSQELRDGEIDVLPDANYACDKTLVRTNFESDFRPAPYSEQIHALAVWMRSHAQLYPHYAEKLKPRR